MFRTLVIIGACGAFLAAVVWLLPIEGILSARGYTPDEIAALKEAASKRVDGETSSDAPSQPSGNPGKVTATESGQTQVVKKPASVEKTEDERESLAPRPSTASSSEPTLVATDTINVRAGQGTDFAVAGKVYRDQSVTVTRDPGGDWIQIKRDDVSGWVYRPLFRAP